MIRLKRTALMLITAGTATLALIGCESDKSVLIDEIRKNPTPEMNTIAHTHNDRKNKHAVVRNANIRQIGDDLDAILLLDRPVRLSPYVIPQ